MEPGQFSKLSVISNRKRAARAFMSLINICVNNNLFFLGLLIISLGFLIVLFIFEFSKFPPACGYEHCPKTSETSINLHLVPHTHNDVGWIKTPDQYYYGVQNSIYVTSVKNILDSVIQELINDPNKRFIYVETAFFWKWWQEQTFYMKYRVRNLVNYGKLEFIGGAWSMNDEAVTHYHSIIDQFTWGFRRLSDAFGKCGRPKVGWQIDPFGHSRQNADIMAKLGFDGLFLGRIDWQDKNYRIDNKTMEMLWKTSQNDDTESATLFTGILYNNYEPPTGFCFDIHCHDERIVDNVNSPAYNVEKRTSEFLTLMKNYSLAYKTKNVLVTMGGDFHYMNASFYYRNMDKLIKHINEIEGPNSPFRAFYSTPSCYLKSVNDAGIKLLSKKDDFFPYSSEPKAFWTGYFTSRPTIKGFERLGNNFLQVCKQLATLSNTDGDMREDLISLREAMGVMQHHDAVTGTEQQHVAAEYARILTKGINDCGKITETAIKKLMKTQEDIKLQSCLKLNISSCDVTENSNSFVVTLYNPLSRFVNHLVQLPIVDLKQSYSVKCPMGKEQLTQILPIPDSVIAIPGRSSRAVAKLVFLAKGIPPLGFKSYYVTKTDENITKKSTTVDYNGQPIVVGFDEGLKLTLTGKGLLKSVTNNKKQYPLTQNINYYVGAVGNNRFNGTRTSGAYIFRPNSSLITINPNPKTIIHKGPLVHEIHQVFSNWVSQIIRSYLGSNYVEFEWLVGPIPVDDEEGKEIVSVFQSQVHNNGEFYIDSNGKESLKRVLNQRETWPLQLEEPIAGNYYPVTTRISIQDNETKISIITDRSQGGSSLEDGKIELMLHRRLLHDDSFGVGEPLNETAFGRGLVALGSHYLTVENNGKARMLVQEKVLNNWLFFTPTDIKFEDYQSNFRMEYSGLSSPLPDNVQILTLEPWSGNTFILRLEHIIEKNDDPELSKPTIVNLENILNSFVITKADEMMLGANMKVEESQRLHWNSDMNLAQNHKTTATLDISLNPMQIRTFLIEMKPQ